MVVGEAQINYEQLPRLVQSTLNYDCSCSLRTRCSPLNGVVITNLIVVGARPRFYRPHTTRRGHVSKITKNQLVVWSVVGGCSWYGSRFARCICRSCASSYSRLRNIQHAVEDKTDDFFLQIFVCFLPSTNGDHAMSFEKGLLNRVGWCRNDGEGFIEGSKCYYRNHDFNVYFTSISCVSCIGG